MNLLHTNEHFSSLTHKEKISLLKGMINGQIPQAKAQELHFTVMVDSNGNYSLLPGGEIIALSAGETIERYLEKKYPLSRVGLQEIDVKNFQNNTGGSYMAA